METIHRSTRLRFILFLNCLLLPVLASVVSKKSSDSIQLLELPISVQVPLASISHVSFIPLSQRITSNQEDLAHIKEYQTHFHADDGNLSESKVFKENEPELSSVVFYTQKDFIDKNAFQTKHMENNTIFINGLNEISSIPVNNELFEGKMIIILRANPTYNYDFGGDKNINWEVQLQGRFKRKPGPLYLSVEIPKEENFRLSWGLRTIVNASCKLIQFFGYDLHKSLGEKGEIPHFASPAFQAFDKFVTTNSSQIHPPKLGQEIEESYDSCIKRRRLEKDHIIDTSLTYTMSFNDTFFDPAGWSVTGIPLFKNIDVSKFANSLRLVLYEVEEEDNRQIKNREGDVRAMVKGKHTKRNIAMWMQMHRSN